MNPLDENDAASWAKSLGALAGELPRIRPELPLTQLDSVVPAPLPPRLSPILDHIRQRHQRRQNAADKLHAQAFLKGR